MIPTLYELSHKNELLNTMKMYLISNIPNIRHLAWKSNRYERFRSVNEYHISKYYTVYI